MARISIVTWDGGGNQPPALALAEALAARGHRVRWIGFESQVRRIEAAGWEISVLPDSSRAFGAVSPSQRLAAVVGLVWTSPTQAAELEAILRAHPADLVVVDCLLFAAAAGVARLGLPVALLFHSSPGSFVAMVESPIGGGPAMLAAFNRTRTEAGLPPARSAWELWVGHPTVVASIPELDPPGTMARPSHRYVGPLAPAASAGTEAELPPGNAPLVIASLSTGGAFGDPLPRLQRIAGALAELPVRLLITCGPQADPAALRLPANARAVAHADHRALMPRAALSIHHAGHGTLMAALAAGVPSLALPNPAADQPYLAQRLQELGAGLGLDRDATEPEIAAAVLELLENPVHRAGAERLRGAIEASPGAPGAAAWLESLLG